MIEGVSKVNNFKCLAISPLALRHKGQSLIEYGLVLALVSTAAIGGLSLLGNNIGNQFNSISIQIAAAMLASNVSSVTTANNSTVASGPAPTVAPVSRPANTPTSPIAPIAEPNTAPAAANGCGYNSACQYSVGGAYGW